VNVWLILPTYNEAENLEQVVRRSLVALPPSSRVLVVDDDSPDGTGRMADELAAKEPAVEVLHRSAREGLGPAYLAGFSHALERGAGVVCQMDADLSHDPTALPLLIGALENADVAIGSRYAPGGSIEHWGTVRRIVSRGGIWYARMLFGLPLRDLTGGFKAFRREAVKPVVEAEIGGHGYVFQIETTYRLWRAGFRIVEVPITFGERRAGRSKMTPAIAVEAAWRVPWARWRLRGRGTPSPDRVPAPMATVHETYDFDVPVERLYQHLSVHENLKPLLGLDVEQIKAGDANGVGSVRKLSVKGIAPFEETVTEAIPNERIEYTITKGTPMRNHKGIMVFSSTGDGGSHLDYTISFDAAVPGLDRVVALGVGRTLRRGLPKVARALS
jgi:dolichol-phosphate mannosyltransferase